MFSYSRCSDQSYAFSTYQNKPAHVARTDRVPLCIRGTCVWWGGGGGGGGAMHPTTRPMMCFLCSHVCPSAYRARSSPWLLSPCTGAPNLLSHRENKWLVLPAGLMLAAVRVPSEFAAVRCTSLADGICRESTERSDINYTCIKSSRCWPQAGHEKSVTLHIRWHALCYDATNIFGFSLQHGCAESKAGAVRRIHWKVVSLSSRKYDCALNSLGFEILRR